MVRMVSDYVESGWRVRPQVELVKRFSLLCCKSTALQYCSYNFIPTAVLKL